MSMLDYQWFPTLAILLGGGGLAGWVFTTWLKVKHGYPIENMWGRPMQPALSNETTERVRMLTQENAQLRAELGGLKDRLATMERIVTDGSFRLDAEIAALARTN